MVNTDDVYVSKYLNVATVTERGLANMPLKIMHVKPEQINKDKPELKLVVTLSGLDKQLVLNKTNKDVIVGAYGKETDNWIGKVIVLEVGQSKYMGQPVKTISVRVPEQSFQGQGVSPASSFSPEKNLSVFKDFVSRYSENNRFSLISLGDNLVPEVFQGVFLNYLQAWLDECWIIETEKGCFEITEKGKRELGNATNENVV